MRRPREQQCAEELIMTDNVISLTKPKDGMPAGWCRHVDILRQTHADIDALRKRLQQEYQDFKDVIKEDMRLLGKPIDGDEQKAMGRAHWHLEKGVRDALTLLELASERVSYACPDDASYR
jgi:hypothetical protein